MRFGVDREAGVHRADEAGLVDEDHERCHRRSGGAAASTMLRARARTAAPGDREGPVGGHADRVEGEAERDRAR